MSEQTPGHSGDALTESEPSMEDILASIRKIIADDADPVPLDGPGPSETDNSELIAPVNEVAEPAVPDAPVADLPPAADDPLDIDALLSGLDIVEPETVATEPVETLSVEADDPLIDLDIPLIPDDPEPAPVVEAASEDPVFDLGARAAESLLKDSAPVADVPTVEADDDLDSLMDELLVDLDEVAPAEELVVDPAEELLAEARAEEALPEMRTEEDMDLVRSLMDDLTDEDVVPETPDTAEAAPVMPVDAEDDVLDDILDMTLDDAIAEQPLDIPEPEPEPIDATAEAMPVPDDHRAEADTPSAPEEAFPSLSDIAASAEADADAVQAAPPHAVAAAAAVGGAALAGGAVALAPGPETEAKAEAAPADTTPPTHETPQQETPMPRAVRSDAILDEVTEEAATSAFAELNQVVEEKAIYSERGPRIGDLVQEALKPMLKEWLDANLKGIVERAVAKEVKRISSGK